MKKLFAMILAGMMAVSMAACGGSSSNAPAADAAFKTVEDGKLHMATNAAFPPYEMTSDNGGYEGIDVEIATKIAEKLGLELVVEGIKRRVTDTEHPDAVLAQTITERCARMREVRGNKYVIQGMTSFFANMFLAKCAIIQRLSPPCNEGCAAS